MNYTTIEQSKKLVELGLNLETADMWWTPLNWQLTEYYVEVKQDGISTPKNPIPCWSLGALLEVIPKYIYTPKENLGLHIFPIDGRWNFEYGYSNNSYSVLWQDKDLLNAAYNMVLWLLENAFLKKE